MFSHKPEISQSVLMGNIATQEYVQESGRGPSREIIPRRILRLSRSVYSGIHRIENEKNSHYSILPESILGQVHVAHYIFLLEGNKTEHDPPRNQKFGSCLTNVL